MIRFIWSDGRLAWPLVFAIVLLTLSLLTIDLIWRTFRLPLESLLMLAALLELGLACAFAIVIALLHRRARASEL